MNRIDIDKFGWTELDEEIACAFPGCRRADRFDPDEVRERHDALMRASKIKTHKPPKSRKPRLDRMIAQAEKATGKAVASITMPDGTSLHFGEPEPTEAKNPWLADLEKRKQ